MKNYHLLSTKVYLLLHYIHNITKLQKHLSIVKIFICMYLASHLHNVSKMNLIIKSQINERRQIPLKGRFEGRFNEGKSEDGRFNEGRFDNGRFNEGRFDEGRFDEGRFDEGRLYNGRLDDWRFSKGKFDIGRFDVG